MRDFSRYIPNPELNSYVNLRLESLEYANKFFELNQPEIKDVFINQETYSNDAVIYDQKLVDALKHKYNQENDINREWSVIQEAIILNEVEQSNWFGEKAETIRPTNHADYCEKIDGVINLNDNLFSFDATFSENQDNLYKKSLHITDLLKVDELPIITYFYNEKSDFKGSVSMPKIIIGFDKNSLEEIAIPWLEAQKNMQQSHEKLAKHPLQLELLFQSLYQFSAYEIYSKNTKSDKSKVFKAIKNDLLKVYSSKLANEHIEKIPHQQFTYDIINKISSQLKITEKEIKDNIWKPNPARRVIKLKTKATNA